MTTDNRANEPSGAMVEAAAKALHETRNPWFGAYGDWGAAGYEIKQAFRESARAALVAAQGAAPQVLNVEKLLTVIGVALDATKADARGEIEAGIRREVKHWLEHGDDVVLPSSGVDEDALAEELESCLEAGSFDNGDTSEPIWFTDDVKALAAHLAEWLKGQER